jgi:hypothetical protein
MDFEHACMHVMLNHHVCVLNRHAVWYGYNAAQCVDSTRMRVIVCQTAAGMCLQLRFMYVYCVQNTRISVKITRMIVQITSRVSKSHTGCQKHTEGASIKRCENHTRACGIAASQNPIRNVLVILR